MPENKPHVLFLPSWYPNRHNPNIGNFVQRHAEAVNPFCKLSVLNIAADDKLERSNTELVDEVINGVKTITVYYKRKSNGFVHSLINRFYLLKAFIAGWKYLIRQRGKPEIIHVSIAYPAGIFAWWINFFLKIPYVISEHWSAYMPANRNRLSWFARFSSKIVFRNASVVMPVSGSLQDAIMQAFAQKAKFRVVPNAVDVSVFYPPNPKPANHNKRQLLHVSTLDEEAKNVFGLFRAIKNLTLTRTDFELHIIHEYYSKRHEDYAREMGLLNTFVFFYGHKTPAEVAEWMRRSDFFVLFSNYESLPVVLIESLACGLPVVATKVGGIPDHINSESGILVKPKDETGLLNALNEMLDHCEDYDSAVLRNYAVKNFSNEVVGESFRSIYDKIIGESKRITSKI